MKRKKWNGPNGGTSRKPAKVENCFPTVAEEKAFFREAVLASFMNQTGPTEMKVAEAVKDATALVGFCQSLNFHQAVGIGRERMVNFLKDRLPDENKREPDPLEETDPRGEDFPGSPKPFPVDEIAVVTPSTLGPSPW